MKEIVQKYVPATIEDKWYKQWLKAALFTSIPDERESYTLVIPPPNVTGVLHMGHMLNNTIQDILIRRARMMGKNACWVPGTDHASIATEAKVVKMLEEKGIKKEEIGREEFLKYAFDWKEKYGGIILKQLEKLGCSCDWKRTTFTMDEGYYNDVVHVFIDLYKKGYIYRGIRMVNWDPEARTTVSDEEVISKPTPNKMCYIKYYYEDRSGFITVATVRPETIMGDVAVAVHPDDNRYKHLAGKKVWVPFVNRLVPVIFDEAIDMEFGTGTLKVTPAHDIVDYEIGLRHHLEVIDILNEDGTIASNAGAFEGLDRFVARKKAIRQLEESGLLEKVEEYSNNVGYSERTQAAIEPRISTQWFLKMDKISKPALDSVIKGEISLYPSKYINTYRHWMENVKDWCLSRQLWWGHRIPAWYDREGKFVVAKNIDEAIAEFAKEFNLKITASELSQDEDVLDTWASSWLWPISVFNGISEPDNAEITYYYPTQDLVTAPEILFFWVARMIMAGFEYRNAPPFKNVYLTGIVRDKQRRKMSKSLGNSPDPVDLIDKYGADGVRLGMLLCSPAGNDILFDESQVEQGRNFANKIWNAYKLIQGWTPTDAPSTPSETLAGRWFKGKYNEVLEEINDDFEKYRLNDALMKIYKLIWDDYCSWYLEMIKPVYGSPISSLTQKESLDILERLLGLIHPVMPFISEELWQNIKYRQEGEYICITKWPEKFDTNGIDAERVLELIKGIRAFRNSRGMSPRENLEVYILSNNGSIYYEFGELISKISCVSKPKMSTEKLIGAHSFLIGTDEIFIPVEIDSASETVRLNEEIIYLEGFLESVRKKLGNPKFTVHANPEVIDKEKKKEADTLSKLKSLKEQLALIKSD